MATILSPSETGWTTTNLKSLGDLDGQDIRACGWLGSTSQFFSTPSANTSFKNGLYSANDVSSIK